MPPNPSAPTVARLRNTAIAFRPTDDEMIMLDALRATMPTGTWSEAMRWLVNADEVRQLIATHLQTITGGPQ